MLWMFANYATKDAGIGVMEMGGCTEENMIAEEI